MKSTDKFLVGIVIGVILLVAAAFVVALNRPKPVYLADNTPRGVVNNYLLALKKHDYKRAYSYLSPEIPGYPATVEKFIADVNENDWQFNFSTQTISIVSASKRGELTEVVVRKTSNNDYSPFSSRYEDTFSLQLKRVAGAWKIVTGSYFWNSLWNENVSGKVN